MKTVLDIPKVVLNKSGYKVYEVETPQQIFEAIEDALSINPLIESIRVKEIRKINLEELKYKYGFDILDYKEKGLITFRGYYRWVYFKDKAPVFFDDSCSHTDYKPHLSTFRNKVYDTLQFDDCKRLAF